MALVPTIPDALYIGATAVDRVYQGPEQIWPEAVPDVEDTFTRADGRLEGSLTEVGALTWVKLAQHESGYITNGVVKTGGAATNEADVVHHGFGSYTVSADLTLEADTTIMAMLVRCRSQDNNFVQARWLGSAWQLLNYGTLLDETPWAGAFGVPQTVTVHVTPTRVDVDIDGVRAIGADTTYQNDDIFQGAGLRLQQGAGSWDNFTIWAG